MLYYKPLTFISLAVFGLLLAAICSVASPAVIERTVITGPVGPPYDSKGRGCCTGGYRDPNK